MWFRLLNIDHRSVRFIGVLSFMPGLNGRFLLIILLWMRYQQYGSILKAVSGGHVRRSLLEYNAFYNEAADMWNVGVILYILLSGVPPIWGTTKAKIFDAARAADLRFSPDLWDHTSVSAKDLISGLLCVDPA